VQRSGLLIGVGGTLAGLGALLGILGAVAEPLLLFAALPLLAAGYVIWYHGTGRMEFRSRVRTRRRPGPGPRGESGERAGGGNASGERAGAGDDGSRWADPEWRRRRRRARRGDGPGPFGEDPFGPGGERDRRRPPGASGDGPTPREAYEVLGLDPGSSSEEVRAAYRDKVKEVHPDREGGSEEAFKRVNDAYETLKERA